jgi:RHS repeat-associated protein
VVDPVLDPNTGLIYMRARWYDPSTAQFLTQDPLQALTGEPYAYASDNPLNETDPTGESGLDDKSCDYDPSGPDCGGNISLTAVGVGLGVVSLATGVGEVLGAGAAVGEGVLGAVSVVSGIAAAGLDGSACLHQGGIACVGAVSGGVGAIAGGIGLAAGAIGGDEDAGALAFEGGDAGAVRAGGKAIGLTFGGIALVGDTAAVLAGCE